MLIWKLNVRKIWNTGKFKSAFSFAIFFFYGKIFSMNGYDLNSLNEEQKKALLEINGVVLVTAGRQWQDQTFDTQNLLFDWTGSFSLLHFGHHFHKQGNQRNERKSGENVWPLCLDFHFPFYVRENFEREHWVSWRI